MLTERQYHYFINCVTASSDEVETLNDMIDDAVKVSKKEFFNHVDFNEINNRLGYIPGEKLSVKTDYYVGFFKSHWGKRPCYFLTHSAIEYIFL